MTTFGSTVREEEPDEAMVIAKKVRDKTATMGGLSAELQIQKQQIVAMRHQINSLQGHILTLQNQFETFMQQRAVELSRLVGHGPTSID